MNPESGATQLTATAAWGTVTTVRPGIGVEVLNGQDHGYVDFIARLLDTISVSTVGQRLVTLFAPRELPFGQPVTAFCDMPGIDPLTLVITQPREAYKSSMGKMIYPVIKTELKGRRTGPENWDRTALITTVLFFRQPVEDEQFAVGDPKERVTVGHEGVTGHPDFVGPQPFHVVLVHELCHAYLAAYGISDRMGQISLPIDKDNFEEQLVVGLAAGVGLDLCENAYRVEVGLPIRVSYHAVNLSANAGLSGWVTPEPAAWASGKRITLRATIAKSLEKDSDWVLTGQKSGPSHRT